MDDAAKPESDGEEEKAPKKKAEDNPWYLLATLYGVPKRRGDDELQTKNRVAWNRYFAANLDESGRAQLVEKRHPAEKLGPFSPGELRRVAIAFAERCKAPAKELALLDSDAAIDFWNVKFEQDAFFRGYLFNRPSDFQNAAFSSGANFNGAAFSGGANFNGAAFSDWANFGGATFSDEAHFDGATFSGVAFFRGAAFSGEATFGSATFSSWAKFNDAAFSDWANFAGATFSDGANFNGAAFSGGAAFRGGTFSDVANFNDAAFSGGAAFRGGTFSDVANFYGATFSGRASFGNATFGKESSFVNAEMKGETSFEGAVFKAEPPRFFGAKLHQGTVWRGIDWPTPKKAVETGAFIDAYACLKLEMDRLKKHEDELDFFALELQSRRVLLGPWRGLPIRLYGILSNYGRSYVRPPAWLFVIAVACAPVFWHFGAKAPIDSLGLSLANLLSVFGFRKDFNISIDSLPVALKILAATQTMVGGALLFLFGLGIRNKFRMK